MTLPNFPIPTWPQAAASLAKKVLKALCKLPQRHLTVDLFYNHCP